jgi:hypothetical protein
LEGLRAWHDDRPIQLIPSDWPGVTQTLHDQKILGWNLFFDGFVTDSWVATQQSYLEFLNKKTTGKRWTSRLIKRMWEIAWDMWRHHMQIMDTVDSLSLLAQMIALDEQVQACFTRHQENPIRAMHRWFSQPATSVASETLDFKEQWLEMVDAAWTYYH